MSILIISKSCNRTLNCSLLVVSACITIARNLRFAVLDKSSGGTQDFLKDVSQSRF